jgi:hypothetical protein
MFSWESSAPACPKWIAPDFARRLNLEDRWSEQSTVHPSPSHPVVPKAHASLSLPHWSQSICNFTNRIALAADISGTYDHGGNLFTSTTIYTYQFGPRIYLFGHHRISPFVHGLLGLSHGNIGIPADPTDPVDFRAFTETDHGYSWDAGGGVDLAFRNRWALRLEADYDQTQLFGGQPNQNNFKVGVGLIYRIGAK